MIDPALKRCIMRWRCCYRWSLVLLLPVALAEECWCRSCCCCDRCCRRRGFRWSWLLSFVAVDGGGDGGGGCRCTIVVFYFARTFLFFVVVVSLSRFMTLKVGSKTTSEIRFIDLQVNTTCLYMAPTVQPTVEPPACVQPTVQRTVEPPACVKPTVQRTVEPTACVQPTLRRTVESSACVKPTLQRTVEPTACVQPTVQPRTTYGTALCIAYY